MPLGPIATGFVREFGDSAQEEAHKFAARALQLGDRKRAKMFAIAALELLKFQLLKSGDSQNDHCATPQ
jgi:hypothetical protein